MCSSSQGPEETVLLSSDLITYILVADRGLQVVCFVDAPVYIDTVHGDRKRKVLNYLLLGLVMESLKFGCLTRHL